MEKGIVNSTHITNLGRNRFNLCHHSGSLRKHLESKGDLVKVIIMIKIYNQGLGLPSDGERDLLCSRDRAGKGARAKPVGERLRPPVRDLQQHPLEDLLLCWRGSTNSGLRETDPRRRQGGDCENSEHCQEEEGQGSAWGLPCRGALEFRWVCTPIKIMNFLTEDNTVKVGPRGQMT